MQQQFITAAQYVPARPTKVGVCAHIHPDVEPIAGSAFNVATCAFCKATHIYARGTKPFAHVAQVAGVHQDDSRGLV